MAAVRYIQGLNMKGLKMQGSGAMHRRAFLKTTGAALLTATGCSADKKQGTSELQVALETGADIELVDQNDAPFVPASLSGKVVLTCSGFHGCPACVKIRGTVAKASQASGNAHVLVINTNPESDHADREAYAAEYAKAGIDPSHLTILFAKQKSEVGAEPSNSAAKDIEKKVMDNLLPGHSPNIVVFSSTGERLNGKGTFAVVTGKQQDEKVRSIANVAQQGLGL
jgi:cytochrome oxidase Cu insertion factor (SCO1/SenC/PrrC family)